MAILRFAVYDDDHELVGIRLLPLNAIRLGFRHVGLRDKHNIPLPLETLFVQINVENWVPDEMDGVCVVFVLKKNVIVHFLVIRQRMMLICICFPCFVFLGGE